jgi:excisionase family DNA binding protein
LKYFPTSGWLFTPNLGENITPYPGLKTKHLLALLHIRKPVRSVRKQRRWNENLNLRKGSIAIHGDEKNKNTNMKTEQKNGQPLIPKNTNHNRQPGVTVDHPANGPLRVCVPATVPSGPVTSNPEPLVYDINQVAFLLNVCPKTVRRLLARGKLTSCNVLRKVLIPRSQIEAFLKATCDKPDFQN